MRRGPWLAVIAAGSVITGVSTTGVIAPAEDVARTGTQTKEYVETAAFPRAVDLEVAEQGGGCDPATRTYTDDLDGPITAIDATSRAAIDAVPNLCVRNVGEEATRLRIRTVDIVGTDLTCRPDEGIACDGNGDIELWVMVSIVDDFDTCPSQWVRTSGEAAPKGGIFGILSADREALVWESTDTIEPGAVCRLVFPTESPNVPEPLPYEAQTDRLEWRYRISTI